MTPEEKKKIRGRPEKRAPLSGSAVFLRKLGVAVLLGLSLASFIAIAGILPLCSSGGFADAGFPLFLFLFSGVVMLVLNLFYFAWQILLASRYHPFPDPGNELLPTLSVIVPAFNEGRQVADTLKSLLASDYPPEKLEIITVNDGSRDDTWSWMHTSAAAARGRIVAIDLPRNAGKRNALYKGLLVAASEIIVTIDSDSIVTPDTLRQIAAPFAADKTIGGVAGNIRVRNLKDGFIPRMLDVSFVFGFEFLRSAQSMVRSVLCTPGALSAYRRSALLPFMNEWVNEKFFGHPANIGEDRALTNILIREGFGVVFQQPAVAYTEMPSTYRSLCKMLIRWGRSNVRENWAMAKFAFKHFDFNDDDLTGMQANLIIQMFWMIAPLVFLFYAFWCFATDTFHFIIGTSVAVLFWATLPAFVYARRYSKKESLWSYAYGIFNFFTLFWISPWCVLSVHRSGWLTRGNPKKTTPAPEENPRP